MLTGLLVDTALAGLVLAGTLGSACFYLLTVAGARHFRRPSAGSATQIAAPWPAMTILKPLNGLEADLYDNLASFCRQDYPQFEIVFGVARESDPAVAVVRRLQADFPQVATTLVVDARVYGTNRKVSNLHNMLTRATHDVLVIADSDIRVPPDYLRRLALDLAAPDVGVVTCLYRAVSRGGLASRMEALLINTDFAPMVLVARLTERPTYAFGATVALRREVLVTLGGLLAVKDVLADDYHLGRLAVAAGHRLVLSGLVVNSILGPQTWTELLQHQVRWVRTYRTCRPGGYFATVLTHGMLWATIGLASGVLPGVAGPLAALLLGLRLATVYLVADAYLGARLRPLDLALLPVKDLFGSALWLLAFLGRTVTWGGRTYRIMSDGRMIARETVPRVGRRVAEPADP